MALLQLDTAHSHRYPKELFDLTGRTVVVTGASSGLGQRAETILASAGAQVRGVPRQTKALDVWEESGGNDNVVIEVKFFLINRRYRC